MKKDAKKNIRYTIQLFIDGINWFKFIGRLFFHTAIAYFLGQFAMDFVGFTVSKYAMIDLDGEAIGRSLAFVVVVIYWLYQIFDIEKIKK